MKSRTLAVLAAALCVIFPISHAVAYDSPYESDDPMYCPWARGQLQDACVDIKFFEKDSESWQETYDKLNGKLQILESRSNLTIESFDRRLGYIDDDLSTAKYNCPTFNKSIPDCRKVARLERLRETAAKRAARAREQAQPKINRMRERVNQASANLEDRKNKLEQAKSNAEDIYSFASYHCYDSHNPPKRCAVS